VGSSAASRTSLAGTTPLGGDSNSQHLQTGLKSKR